MTQNPDSLVIAQLSITDSRINISNFYNKCCVLSYLLLLLQEKVVILCGYDMLKNSIDLKITL